jgi:hypothetical protein
MPSNHRSPAPADSSKAQRPTQAVQAVKPAKEPLAQRVGRKLNFLNWAAIALLIASSVVVAFRHGG